MRFVGHAALAGAVLAIAACSQGEKKADEAAAAPPPAEAAAAPAEATPAAETAPAPETTAAPETEPAPEAASPETTEMAAPATTEAAPAPTTTAAAPAAEGTITLAAVDASGAPLVGDLARGKKVFAQCMTCHTLQEGVNRTGPSLHKIINRPAGSVPGFRYSKGNSTSGIVWSEQELFAYLENPRAKVPGTIMAFVGLKDAQQRADVIAYIKANGGE